VGWLLHWLAVHTGTVNEPGPYYGFWSGFGSDLGEITLIGVILGALGTWYRRNNCHIDRCRRLSHRQVSGLDEHGQPVTFHVCRRHHPAPAPAAEDVRRAHHAARHRHQDPGCASPAEQVRAQNSAAEISDTQARKGGT
jgi:hypothetical protein